MPPKRKALATKKAKPVKEAQQPSLVDQLSMIAQLDDDDQLMTFDSNEGAKPSSPPPPQPPQNDTVTKRKVLKPVQPSKIPTLSPQKPSHASTSSLTPISVQKLNEEIETLFKQRDASKLLDLNKTLKGGLLKELEKKYQSQLDRANKLIDKLVLENESLTAQAQTLDVLRTENEFLKNQLKSSTTAPTVGDKDSTVVFDIIELLANLSCLEFVEDEDKMQFTLKQTGNEVEMTYKLIINKSEKVDEILYMPIFTNDDEAVKKRLPDYFLGDLSFPSSNLNNFYNKISRSLNKNI